MTDCWLFVARTCSNFTRINNDFKFFFKFTSDDVQPWNLSSSTYILPKQAIDNVFTVAISFSGSHSNSCVFVPAFNCNIYACISGWQSRIHMYICHWARYFFQHRGEKHQQNMSPDYHLQLFDNNTMHRVVGQLILLCFSVCNVFNSNVELL